MNVIVAEIIGGLGNQMFQYATAKVVALEHKRQLQLDLSLFKKYKLHNGYELKRVFGVSDTIATQSTLLSVFGIWQFVSILSPKVRNRLARFLVGRKFIHEKDFCYNKIKIMEGDQYLSGYWQSAKYFENHAEIIRKIFSFQLPDNDQLKSFREAISVAGKNAVSVHVRRGDYLAKKNVSLFATLDDRYYIDAINFIRSKRKETRFFVFSDDIDWCRTKFIGEEFVFVSGFSHDMNYIDMYLMSICNSNIIANSTFSWWGAWLNKTPGRIVVAPVTWFADKGIKHTDIYPVDWVLL